MLEHLQLRKTYLQKKKTFQEKRKMRKRVQIWRQRERRRVRRVLAIWLPEPGAAIVVGIWECGKFVSMNLEGFSCFPNSRLVWKQIKTGGQLLSMGFRKNSTSGMGFSTLQRS